MLRGEGALTPDLFITTVIPALVAGTPGSADTWDASGPPAVRPSRLAAVRGVPATRAGMTDVFVGTESASSHPAKAQVLGLQVLLEALGRALAAQAAFLDPAERRDLGGDQAFVDPDHARLDLLATRQQRATSRL